jgi:small-conductance mechanosensitive channel
MPCSWSRFLLDEDLDAVMQLLKDVGMEMRRDPLFSTDILEAFELVGIEELLASHVTIKGRMKTVPVRQWRVAREFRRRLKKVFDSRGSRSSK